VKISEVIRELQEIQEKYGDIKCIIFTGKWHDCRSSDWKWPIVNEVLPITFKNPHQAAICSEYGEGKGFGM